MKKMLLALLALSMSTSALASSLRCEITQGGFDPISITSVIAEGDLATPVKQAWNISLGEYEIMVWKTLEAGAHPAYPLGLLEIAFVKKISGSSASIYTAQLYPQGVSNGHFFTEGLTNENFISYRCDIQ